MVKHTQTIRRQIVDEVFDRVWQFGWLGLKVLCYNRVMPGINWKFGWVNHVIIHPIEKLMHGFSI